MLDITGSFTKVYFVELEFEKSVYPNITELLERQKEIIVSPVSPVSPVSTVTEINITTGKQTYNA